MTRYAEPLLQCLIQPYEMPPLDSPPFLEISLVLPMLCLGACLGSFLGVVIYRLPMGHSPAAGRSACESCGAALQARDLVPVFSFLWLRGHCRHCRAPLRREVLAVELAAAAMGGVCAGWFAAPGPALCAALLGWGLLALGWIDAKHFWLPDVITLPLALAGLAVTAWFDRPDLLSHVITALAAYGLFRLINLLYKWLRHRDGLGQGDAKLMALAGAWLGWQSLPWVVLGAGLLGIAVAAAQRGKAISGGMVLPFGALLAPVIFMAFLMVFPG